MKKLLMFFIFCTVIFLCNSSCEIPYEAWGIWVNNNSDKDVHIVIGFDLINENYYPTTELPNDSIRVKRLVKAHSRGSINFYPYEAVKIKSNDKIAIFVIDVDTMAKYTWNQLRENENYLKRDEFRGDDLYYEVVYP